jgi:hypothetical protein
MMSRLDLARAAVMTMAVLTLAGTTPGCGTPPPVVDSLPARTELADAEVTRRIENARQLALAGEADRALAALALAEDEALSQDGRRQLTRAASDVRRSAFWAECPLIGELSLATERVRYGDDVVAHLTLTQFGEHPLRLVARKQSVAEWLTGDVGERAVLELTIERRECDANGTRLVERENRSLAIDEDIVIEPGGSVELAVVIPLAERRGMLFGQLSIAANLRPVTAEHGDASRYDALPIPPVHALAVRKSVEPWFDGGLDRLTAELDAVPRERPEALLLTLAGLPDHQLRSGIERTIRALPSLDPVRRRLAHGALEWLLGEQLGEDSVALIAWWDTASAPLDDASLAALRIGGGRRASSWLAGGLRDR